MTEGARLMRQLSRPRKPRDGEDPAGIYWHDDREKLETLTPIAGTTLRSSANYSTGCRRWPIRNRRSGFSMQ